MVSYRVHGKWILAGEHAVLRGGEALVFPVSSRYLDFEYHPGESPLSLNIEHAQQGLETAFWQVYERALTACGLKSTAFGGHLRLSSQIPVGAGMGASATLCAALALWFVEFGHIHASQRHAFAKSLEDLFHGESSGVDVAVALENRPLSFHRPADMVGFEPRWQPHFYLSYCGEPGDTAHCIAKVNELWQREPELAKTIDENMHKAVALAKRSLLNPEPEQELLRQAIEQARQCFIDWQLVSPKLATHMEELSRQGALAVKPTGSGLGGFVLSLWEEPPQDPEPLGLIKA